MTRKRRLLLAALWFLCLIAIASGVEVQALKDAPPSHPPSGVELQIKATPTIGTVGDRIRIDLDISMPPGYQVEISPPATQTGDFTILEFSPGLTESEKEGTASSQSSSPRSAKRMHHHAQIFTAVYKTGKFTFPPLQAKLRTDQGKTITVASNPVTIEIQTVLTDKDSNLKDLKKQAEIPEPFHWALWIGIVLALLILCVLLRIFWKRRKQPKNLPQAPPENLLDLAEAELHALLARGLPATGMEKQFYIQLSEIIKKILEAAYKISTIEQTTSEIMDLLRSRPTLKSESMAQIESFLIRCDMVKFAKYIPSMNEHETARNNALQILKSCRQFAVVSG